jgi:hypothetical protein
MKTGTLKSAQILAPFEQFQGADDGLLTEFATGYLAPQKYASRKGVYGGNSLASKYR